jgi:dienelactone hydrolase
MIVTRAILTLMLSAQQLYEEKLLDTMALREKHWQQMDVHANRGLLRARIGFPVPSLKAAGPLRLEKSGEDAIATYYRSWLPITEGEEVYGLYVVPKKPIAKRAPLVISKHGGGGFPEMATFNGGTNYKDQVRGAVAEGYIVYAPLSVMYPFRDRDNGTVIPADVRKILDEKFRAAGTSLAAVEVQKISLVLDEFVKRPEIDPKRIAMIGLSYGGYYSLYTAALDPRIRVVAASCSFSDLPAITDGKTEGRLLDLTPSDVAALIAPRPLQIQGGTNDKGLPIQWSRAAAKRTALVYEKLGAADKFTFEEFEGGHEFRGSLVWPFLKKWL